MKTIPYLIPKTNNYFGFMPARAPVGLVPSNIYLVSSSEANAISPGDVLVYTTHSTGLPTVRRINGSTTTDAGVPVGVAASAVPANGGLLTADVRVLTSQNVLVYDSPYTIFTGCDTTSGVVGFSGGIGKSYGVVATGAIGSTGPSSLLGRSVMALSGVTASSQGVFRVIGVHPIEVSGGSTVANATAVAAAGVRKWLLQPDRHAHAGFGVGIGVVST